MTDFTRRGRATVAAVGVVVAGLLAVPAARAAAPPPTGATTAAATPAGLPDDVPPAALKAEPALPVPAGWPFPDQFPRTSGTGRLVGGAFEWSDFLYDDHGAKGVQVATSVTSLANSIGTYVYPAGNADMNGADIFRAGVGATDTATYWRVDWNTLADPTIPIAEWAIDTDDNATTGVAAWPAGAGVRSPGIEKAILVSSRGAWLIDAKTGARTALRGLTVDKTARSFVVRIPADVLTPSGTWRVRLAAGLAAAGGVAFAPVGPSDGATAGEPAVYNATFRAYDQEPEQGNYWMDSAQATALAAGDVTPFSALVDWRRLDARQTTPEPLPTGYTNRWYVSSIDLGQGVVRDAGTSGEDLRPNFLGRVQPYAVYVPTHYRPAHAAPLTWLLHSLDEQHNQYGSLNPKFVTQACEDRGSICVTTLGRGPDGWYFDEAELDFWEVWNRVASAYHLDPDRTVLSGYSMGGWATYKLGLAHPDLFSKAVVLEGPVICGLRAAPGFPGAAGPGRCTTDGDSLPVIASARNLPYVISQGALDELVPLPGMLPDVQKFDSLGYRYRFELYPAADHLAYPTLDGFSEQAAQMTGPPRVRAPAHVTYAWYPNLDRPDLGIGATGAYWVRDVRARTVAAGMTASLDAVSREILDPAVMPAKTTGALVPGDPFPAVVQQQSWSLGAVPAGAAEVTLTLANVGSLAVDLARAGFTAGQHGTLRVTSDGPAAITLLGGGPVVRVPAGTSTIGF